MLTRAQDSARGVIFGSDAPRIMAGSLLMTTGTLRLAGSPFTIRTATANGDDERRHRIEAASIPAKLHSGLIARYMKIR